MGEAGVMHVNLGHTGHTTLSHVTRGGGPSVNPMHHMSIIIIIICDICDM